MRKILNKSGMGAMGTVGVIALVLIAIVVVIGGVVWMFGSGVKETTVDDSAAGLGGTGAGIVCPDNLEWSGTFTLENLLNASTADAYDETAYFFDTEGGLRKAKITDTTDGTLTLTCGQTYLGQLISSSSSNSRILTAQEGITINDEENIEFTVGGDGASIIVESSRHCDPELRVKDTVNNEFLYGNSSNSNPLAYNYTDGVVYGSYLRNDTGSSVGSGGEYAVNYEYRAHNTYCDNNDRGVYVLVNAKATVWAIPVVKIDGVKALNVKGSALDPNEAIAYSDYEYVYLIPSGKAITSNDKVNIGIAFRALGGVDPSTDANIDVDFAPRGQYESVVTTNKINIGSVKDNSDRTAVHTLWDTTLVVA